jgi:uncharacterized protein YsxB (DUF464 family)
MLVVNFLKRKEAIKSYVGNGHAEKEGGTKSYVGSDYPRAI